MLSGEILGSGAGLGLLALIAAFVFKIVRPDRGVSKKLDKHRPLSTLEDATLTAQSGAAEARKVRENADDKAHKDIMARPTTSDAAADLAARLSEQSDDGLD